jgi:tetratricopeptide (TPR) repeat protein
MPAAGRFAVVAGVVLLLGLGASHARAQGAGDKEAQGLFKKAEIQFGLQNYKLALDLYKMAHDLKPRASYLFNIGLCHHRLGQFDKAIRTFELYLFQEPEADDRSDVQGLIAKLRVAKLRATQLKQAPVKQPANETAAPGDGARDDAPRDPGALHKALLWSGVGLTVALLAAGTVTGQLASDRSESYNDPATPAGDLQGLKDSGETLRTVSIATFAAGGAVALGTTLYYLLGYRRAGSAVALTPTLGGVAISGGF